MVISGNGLKFCYNMTTANNTKDASDTGEFALEKTGDTRELSEAEEMELFKKEFYEDLSKLTVHKTLNNVAINISEAGFKAMKEDSQYREKILSLLQRDLGSSVAPRNCSAMFTVGATLSEYRGDSWPVGNDSEFYAHSRRSFFKKMGNQRHRRTKLLQEYMQRRKNLKF